MSPDEHIIRTHQQRAHELTTLAYTLVCAIVDHTEEVTFDVTMEGDNIGMLIYVADRDVGQAVGRDAANAKTIRDLLYLAARKNNLRINISIISNKHLEDRR